MANFEKKLDTLKHQLHAAVIRYQDVTFSCSFSLESMMLFDLIERERLPVSVFTIDTGRLHEETYKLMHDVRARYATKFTTYFPDADRLQQYVTETGHNAFYDSAAYRQTCCHIRKVEPLRRALQGKDAWLTGLRTQQSESRSQLQYVSYEPEYQLTKISPIKDWGLEDVWTYIRRYDVPYNPLHDQGYISIGCEPCTRAITPGEDIRAGRWWWEQGTIKECGLHASARLNGMEFLPQRREDAK